MINEQCLTLASRQWIQNKMKKQKHASRRDETTQGSDMEEMGQGGGSDWTGIEG